MTTPVGVGGRRAALTALATGLTLALAGCGEPTASQQIAETMRRAESIRGLPATRAVPFRLLGADAAFDDLIEQWAVSDDATETEGEALVLERLGLLPPGFDIRTALEWSTRSGVVGYYDPETAEMTVVSEAEGVGPRELMVVAHEQTHALQDQHHGLESRLAAVDDDAAAALDALIEGEATLVMAVWMIKRLGIEDLESIGSEELEAEPMPVDTMPAILLRSGEFAYVDGAAFVYRRWLDGGWDAIDALWESPPLSSEQVMHPEQYPDDLPQAVELPDISRAMGEGWRLDREMTMGEMAIGVLVADGAWWPDTDDAFTFPRLASAQAAAGWGGDRLAHLVGPDGSWLIAWQTTWDQARDASQFAAAAEDAFEDLPFAWGVLSGMDVSAPHHSDPVLILVADDEATYTHALRSMAVLEALR